MTTSLRNGTLSVWWVYMFIFSLLLPCQLTHFKIPSHLVFQSNDTDALFFLGSRNGTKPIVSAKAAGQDFREMTTLTSTFSLPSSLCQDRYVLVDQDTGRVTINTGSAPLGPNGTYFMSLEAWFLTPKTFQLVRSGAFTSTIEFSTDNTSTLLRLLLSPSSPTILCLLMLVHHHSRVKLFLSF